MMMSFEWRLSVHCVRRRGAARSRSDGEDVTEAPPASTLQSLQEHTLGDTGGGGAARGASSRRALRCCCFPPSSAVRMVYVHDSSRGARIGARRPPRRDVRAAGGTDEHEAMCSGYTSSFLDRSGTNTLWSLPGDELTSLMRTRVLQLHGEILGIPTLLYTKLETLMTAET